MSYLSGIGRKRLPHLGSRLATESGETSVLGGLRSLTVAAR